MKQYWFKTGLALAFAKHFDRYSECSAMKRFWTKKLTNGCQEIESSLASAVHCFRDKMEIDLWSVMVFDLSIF
jgi:hypothetical protein